MIIPQKQSIEYRFENIEKPKLSITIITDKDNRITEIRNPFRIKHPFKLFYFLHTTVLNAWKETNGFVERGRMTLTENIRGSELIKFMIKNPVYHYNFR
jgi:hypothetical protein